MRKRTRSIRNSSGQSTNMLYVIFHGLISLVDIGSGFVAYVLEMGPDHTYSYGNWLAEEEIPARIPAQDPMIATLLGVDHGDDHLNAKLNAVLNLTSRPPINHPYVRAVLYLPRPYQIQYALSGLLPPIPFGGPVGNLADTPTHISGIRVFEYTFQDFKSVSLTASDGHVWTCPQPAQSKDSNDLYVAVLHIYDEPGQELAGHDIHNRREFNRSATFLGSDLLLVKNTIQIEDNPTDIPGLLDGELEFLSQREPFVIDLVQIARGGKASTGTGSGGGQVCGGLNATL